MREIKFRAWDTIGNLWLNMHGDIKLRDFVNAKDIIPMQYTGLKDKNGKEIYEGDVLFQPPSKSRGNKKLATYEGRRFQVIYIPEFAEYHAEELLPEGMDGQLWALAKDSRWDAEYERMIADEMEIIGNIYENPKLLT